MDSQPALNRVSILGVPLDILPEERLEEILVHFEDGANHQIVLLSLWDLLRARRPGEYRSMVLGASLVLPISQTICRGARFLKKTEPFRYIPFNFAIRLLSALEKRGKSAYLLGSSRASIQKAEANIKSTFPGLRVVGRHAGRYPRQIESDIILALRKATPSLLLVGTGVPGRERWIPRNLAHFDSGIFLWCSDLFEIFAERRSKPSRELVERGLEWGAYLLHKPWKAYRIFILFWFYLLLLASRLRGA